MNGPASNRRSQTALGALGGRLRAFALIVLLGLPAPVAGQFSVQPAIVEIVAGDTTTSAVVSVRNEATEPVQLRFYAADFEQERSGDHRFLEAGEHPRSCVDRLRFYPDGATLQEGEIQEVRVLMEPLDSTCWSMLFVESASRGEGGIRIAQRIGVKVYGIATREVPEGEITSVEVTGSGDDRAVVIAFSNRGSAPVRPEGEVEIRTLDGEVIELLPVQAFSVLPGRTREASVPLEAALGPGTYVLVPILDFGGEYLAGGQAILEVAEP